MLEQCFALQFSRQVTQYSVLAHIEFIFVQIVNNYFVPLLWVKFQYFCLSSVLSDHMLSSCSVIITTNREDTQCLYDKIELVFQQARSRFLLLSYTLYCNHDKFSRQCISVVQHRGFIEWKAKQHLAHHKTLKHQNYCK